MAGNECVILGSDSRGAFNKPHDSSPNEISGSFKNKDDGRVLVNTYKCKKVAQKPSKSHQEVHQVQKDQRCRRQRANRKKESLEEPLSDEDKINRRSPAPQRENFKPSRVNLGDKDAADALKCAYKEKAKVPESQPFPQRTSRESLKKGLSSNQDTNSGKNSKAAHKYKKSEKNACSNGGGDGDISARLRVHKPAATRPRSPNIPALEGNIVKRNVQPFVAYAGPQFQNIPSAKMLPFPILSGVSAMISARAAAKTAA